MRIEEREYVIAEKVDKDILDAINKVMSYCRQHEEFEDCRRCVLGDGIHNSGCSSPWLWRIREEVR